MVLCRGCQKGNSGDHGTFLNGTINGTLGSTINGTLQSVPEREFGLPWYLSTFSAFSAFSTETSVFLEEYSVSSFKKRAERAERAERRKLRNLVISAAPHARPERFYVDFPNSSNSERFFSENDPVQNFTGYVKFWTYGLGRKSKTSHIL